MLDDYRTHAAERQALGIPPRPLNPAQLAEVIDALCAGDRAGANDGEAGLLDLLANRVSPGVGEASRLKAQFLARVSGGQVSVGGLEPAGAVRLLGTMVGGYNVAPLVALLDHPLLGALAAEQLSRLIFVLDSVGALDHQGPGRPRRRHRRPSRLGRPGLAGPLAAPGG